MKQLFTIAEALGYKKLDRLRKLDSKISSAALEDFFKTSIVEPYAIFFFPSMSFEITPFGMSIGINLSRQDAIYLIAYPELSEKFLRQVFTGFELVIYKICHIVLEDQKANYSWEKETTRQRMRRLESILGLSNWDEFYGIFDDIFFVRDAFAHSFVPLENIKYNGVPLRECFGESYRGHTLDDATQYGARLFTDDLKRLFEPIINLFCQHQLKQIDAQKFFKLCDRLLMERSLSPGP
jgi:hypothetical protein